MRNPFRSIALSMLLVASCTAFGADGSDMATPSDAKITPKSPELQARQAFSTGVRAIEKGDDALADEARQTDARKKQKSRTKAQEAYTSASRKFEQVIEFQSTNHDAWSYLGYAQLKLGNYEEALTVYGRVLAMKPGNPEAIEHRGHAFLALDRLSEAKEAYLTLFPTHRKLAATLLAGMEAWVAEHRLNPVGVDNTMVETFATWVKERKVIAGNPARAANYHQATG